MSCSQSGPGLGLPTNLSSGSRAAGDSAVAVSVTGPSGCETIVPGGTPVLKQWNAVSTVSSLSRIPVHSPAGGMLITTTRVGPPNALPPMIGWSAVEDGSLGLADGLGGSTHAAMPVIAMTMMAYRMSILSGTCRG